MSKRRKPIDHFYYENVRRTYDQMVDLRFDPTNDDCWEYLKQAYPERYKVLWPMSDDLKTRERDFLRVRKAIASNPLPTTGKTLGSTGNVNPNF